ncbi:MAG: DUF4124 domain-containing protein [Xanthomonadales bacterium]|nr:DUF4124 domain-containing protein [Xanthomonadales bacterium]
MKTITSAPILTLLLLALLAVPATAQSSRVYKWQDEHGNVHYSDRLPSGQEAQNRVQLNHNGVMVHTLDPAPVTAQAAAERQELLRSAQRDVALMVTFQHEGDLRRAHEERLGLLRSSLAIARGNVGRLEAAVTEHERHASSLVEAGQAVPAAVARSLDQARGMLAEQLDDLSRLERRHQDALDMQDAELRRFRELAGTH